METIGFYALLPSQDAKGHLGALLVTDDLGKPVEFRVTYPVKPTLLQRQLYGDSLLPHIGIELCGKPLYQALKGKPGLVLVSDAQLLPLADGIPALVAHVQRFGETLAVAAPTQAGLKPALKLQTSSGRFQPLTLICPVNYDDKRQQEAQSQINRFFASIDLLEPFARIDAAAKALAAQDEKFR
jgi:hypothetical protein